MSNEARPTSCPCDDYEVCIDCAPDGLATLLQLKLSLRWAREPAFIRALVPADRYLAISADDN